MQHGHGGTYSDHVSNSGKYYSTYTSSKSFQYQKSGGGTGSGTMTVTVHTAGAVNSAQVVFKKGPDPKPKKDDGHCNACWAMGTNPQYDPNANDIPDAGNLATGRRSSWVW
ncbi:hypothetical protein ACWD3J_44590 [Streptomyces sp. NPDC002755]